MILLLLGGITDFGVVREVTAVLFTELLNTHLADFSGKSAQFQVETQTQ